MRRITWKAVRDRSNEKISGILRRKGRLSKIRHDKTLRALRILKAQLFGKKNRPSDIIRTRESSRGDFNYQRKKGSVVGLSRMLQLELIVFNSGFLVYPRKARRGPFPATILLRCLHEDTRLVIMRRPVLLNFCRKKRSEG